jgi:DMSO/TMAO reductase YedYZ molybdopterin-dependent catalytic subunit
MSWIRKAYRHVHKNPGLLAVGGVVDRPSFGLSFADLVHLPGEYQVTDVGAYCTPARIAGAPMQGVRLRAIFEHVSAHPEVMFVNFEAENGFKASVWRREIEALAIVVYARGDLPLVSELGGPFRLLLPGFKDEARDIWQLATIEFSDRAEKDSSNARSEIPPRPIHAGEIQGGLSRATIDTMEARTIVTPPPQ